jgi:aldehyde dehydrogenase (NAD+)
VLKSVSPIDGKVLASVRTATAADYERAMERAAAAFAAWQSVPAPKRGELIRQFGNALRAAKSDLGRLVTLEAGKILAEGEGEVQEMIDICDFAVGLSRQLYGLTMPSERPGHRMSNNGIRLGIVGIISAFNFPVAVWAWNSALAIVCGDATLWKPSEQTPLCAIATIKIAERVCRDNGVDPALFSLAIGGREAVGEKMAHDKRLPLISATGSTHMGRDVGEKVQRRLGRALLELGGNNAIIVAASADLDLATRAILFGAVGTAGQRCTSTRRVFVHRSLEKELTKRLINRLPAGADRQSAGSGHVDGAADQRRRGGAMQQALRRLREEGGEILYGGRPLTGEKFPGGRYVEPCLAKAGPHFKVVQEETFAPILYLMPTKNGGSHRLAQRRAAGIKLRHFHQRPARGGTFPFQPRQRLRHRQREHRHQRRGNRRRLWRRERNRRRPRKRQRRLEKLHAPPNRDCQLLRPIAAGPRHPIKPMASTIYYLLANYRH